MKIKTPYSIVRLLTIVSLAIAPASVATAAQTIKTIYETQKLIASDRDADDRFGTSVSVSGNLAIVGAPLDDNGTSGGSAYIFAFDGTTWNQQAILTASGSAEFGAAVAISGSTVLVGDLFDSTKGSSSGAVYVFTFDGTAWTQQAKIVDPNEAGGSGFGASISVSGNTAVIGALYDNDKGAAYIFTFDGTAWSEQAKLTASDGELTDDFGSSVSLSGNRALVGAYVNENFTGAAYVFSFDGSAWSQEAKLTALDAWTGDRFGWSVALSGNTALVGALYKSRAYIFAFDGTTWNQQIELKPPGNRNNAYFGSSVALANGVALVGAHHFLDPGAIYEFVLRRNTWTLRARLLASDGMSGDYLGVSVALSGNTVLAGADDTFNSDRGGEAYIFSLGR
jgi:hypothetical protein